MPILLHWLRQTKGWPEFNGMKPSPAASSGSASGACSSVSCWPSISSDGPVLGWLCLNQQQKQKSKVYFPAVDNFLLTLSANRKPQVIRPWGPVRLPGVGAATSIVPPHACRDGTKREGHAAAAEAFLAQVPGPHNSSHFCVTPGPGEGLEKWSCQHESSRGRLLRTFLESWKQEMFNQALRGKKILKKKKKKKKSLSFWAARMFVKSLLRLLWCWVSAGCFIKDSWDTLLAH